MRNGTLAGLVTGFTGLGAGTHMAMAPVLHDLGAGAATASEAGISLAIVASILGLSCAVMGIIYRRFNG